MWCTFVGPILQPGTFPRAWKANSSWCGGNERLVYISQTAADSHFFILTTSKIHLPGFCPNCATIPTHISTWNLHTPASKLFPRMTAVHTCRIPPKLTLIWHYNYDLNNWKATGKNVPYIFWPFWKCSKIAEFWGQKLILNSKRRSCLRPFNCVSG